MQPSPKGSPSSSTANAVVVIVVNEELERDIVVLIPQAVGLRRSGCNPYTKAEPEAEYH